MAAQNLLKSILILGVIHFIALQVRAEDAAAEPRTSDKLNIEKLEEKYWSVKDDDFTVVQNRAFTKEGRYFASLQSGRLINDGFSEGAPTSFSLGYYKSEHLGFEANYTKWDTKDNNVTAGFQNETGAYPNFNRPVSTTSVGVIFVPFYAKVSLMSKKILYFDMSVTLNAGKSDYQIEQEAGDIFKSTSHYGLDITQTLFLSKNIAIRFDIRNKWSAQEQKRYYTSGAGPRDLGNAQLLDTSMLFGFTYFH